MVEFAGWEMPVCYTSIIAEHNHTREAASLFDVSHMGRIELRGDEAEALLQLVCTRQLGDMVPGQSRYSHVCNEDGGILDDIIVSRYEDRWLVVCNATNREKIVGWLERQGQDHNVAITDTTVSSMMIALQGPKAAEILASKAPIPIDELKRYHFVTGSLIFFNYTCFRNGYTGEDGFEMIVPASIAPHLGMFLGSNESGIKPAGLGARDTLRLEAGMPLYGHELSEQVDPISAGQGWCVDLNKDFIGANALRRVKEAGPTRRIVGLTLAGKRIARQHAPVYQGEREVGEVTSGTLSPTLGRSIAMAYVDESLAQPGTIVSVGVGPARVEAEIVKLPFYKRVSG